MHVDSSHASSEWIPKSRKKNLISTYAFGGIDEQVKLFWWVKYLYVHVKKSLWVNKTTENNVFTIHSMNLNLCVSRFSDSFHSNIWFSNPHLKCRTWFNMIVAIKHQCGMKKKDKTQHFLDETRQMKKTLNEPQLCFTLLSRKPRLMNKYWFRGVSIWQ